jgi:hypothetical protein
VVAVKAAVGVVEKGAAAPAEADAREEAVFPPNKGAGAVPITGS